MERRFANDRARGSVFRAARAQSRRPSFHLRRVRKRRRRRGGRIGRRSSSRGGFVARARRVWGGEIVAVTGSAGKTTTKDVIAALLAECVPTARSEGNLNNHVGLPLSLLRLEEQARVGVVEIGMNHAGEIRHLAGIARPNVGVVTNVGWAHIEFFDSIEGIAAAKRELIEALDAGGTAVLNADDPRVAQFTHRGRTIFYGLSPAAGVRAEQVKFSLEGVSFRVGATNFTSVLTGRHNLSNILAGIAVAGAYGI